MDHAQPPTADRLHLPAGQLRIVDAAAEAFMERGYDATSIDEVATRIGATKGAVYYSYRSKLDLFLAVYERGMLLLADRVEQALTATGGASAAERLRAVSVAHARNILDAFTYHVVIQNGVEHRRQMALKDADRRRLAELDELRAAHEELVHALVVAGQQDGSLRPLPTRLATRTLIGGVVGVAIWYRPRPDQDDAARAELAEQVVAVLLGGLLP
ncbi:TetR/AcrR family transcriptional regulator [Klenkia taihuensis]|uniref:Transcriptional regulator, TetR family n=1 Tax=Klenkia taihuensis TaxID=1225127 RepID=A0A1I1P757_9ACTN|nr:TetR/AcrR family transcriptional regulator [Klenkia taihuensis]GHE11651.1 TetR family transcriptional regulator [Klenkia taihuensis]SFD01820.1 transcriptional regulator, TetR family [Klenkia taihuensis]